MRLPFGIYFIVGLLLCIQSDVTNAQYRRSSTIARSLGVNPKATAQSSDSFECPEEFGYYAHPNDCSQYYVCVFGGALLESCTGGLMYSHELQTCDWPRNVGCEPNDDSASQQHSGRQQKQHDAYHVVPNKFRFSSISSTPQTERFSETFPVRHSTLSPSSSQSISPVPQTLPPPPNLRIAPNPVITSRGQPKPFENIDIATLYSEAHDSLPPIEEDESDRQQRVYRGQPSTVGQVQRDRDGLITQHVNALPSHGKVGSFAFGSQINQHKDIPDIISLYITDNKIDRQSIEHLSDRKKRDIDNDESDSDDELTEDEREAIASVHDEQKTEVGKRTVRQLRPPIPPPPIGSPWPFGDNFGIPNNRLLATSRANSGQLPGNADLNVNFNTFLTPPGNARSNDFYKNNGSPSSSFFQLPFNNKPNEYNPYGNPFGPLRSPAPNAVTEFNSPKPYTVHTTFDLGDAQSSFKPSPKPSFSSQQIFFPITQKSAPKQHSSSPAGDIDSLPENFAYYHTGNGAQIKTEFARPRPNPEYQEQAFQNQQAKVPQPHSPIYFLDKPTTPKSHYGFVSTVGGFLNNNPTPYTGINNKQQKIRPSTEKYDIISHRPVFREPAAVHENQNTFYNIDNTDIAPYYNPFTTQRTTPGPVVASSIKSYFNNNDLKYSNFDQNTSPKSQNELYSYEVTTNGLKPIEKTKGFPITQTPKEPNVEKYTRPSIKNQAHLHEQKQYEQSTVAEAKLQKRPSFVGPQVGIDFDFNKFVYNIRESQQSYIPKAAPKFNTIARPVQPDTVIIRPQSKTKIQTTTPNPDDYYYDVDEGDGEEEEKSSTTPQKPSYIKNSSDKPSAANLKHSTTTVGVQTVKLIKANIVSTGYSHPSGISTPQTYVTTFNFKDPTDQDDYYEYEDEEYQAPPKNASKFMPMSETAAPRPYQVTTKRPIIYTQKPLRPSTTTKKYATTIKPNNYYDKEEETTSTIPSIIKFPEDIFQGVRPIHHQNDKQSDIQRYLNQSTLRPYTLRTRNKPTESVVKVSKAPKMYIKTTTTPKHPSTSSKLTTENGRETTTIVTTSTPKTKTFAIRAKHIYSNNNGKGQQQQLPKLQQTQSHSTTNSNNNNQWKQSNKAQNSQQQRPNALKKNLWELDERLPNRVESSSSLPQAPEGNRNYYNATNNQEYNNPTQQFNSYFSVYDDAAEDSDLYRDDYSAQYNNNNNNNNNNRSPSQPKYVQTTYRPSTATSQTVSTSTKNNIPQREQSYVSSSKPTYEQSVPAHEAYNPEYDEALVAQLEADNEYDQPTKTQIRTNTRNRGSSHFASGGYNDDRTASGPTANRGTHPPRARPTLKPSGSIVSKAQGFVDIYRNPPSRPDPLYPQPIPDKTAAKCRKDVCLLPDCSCGGKEIPGDLPVEDVPQIVLLTFDDSVNDLNKQLYSDLFSKGRVNPNGCPISATFYVSHEWTDYSQVQNLYSDGHEIASHTVSHSFGEQFTQKKWTREVSGQREILAAYGGVKLNDVRGMRAPFLSIGGNKMFKMLYDSNFTYDSSMPVYENRPPSWPYTLDYKIFHDCMIPPCPTKSYPGVWQVPMVMWQDLNGGRCSMGDACSNPPDAEGVQKMIMKNFDRHYTTNRAPFGLFYHAAWFTQPHHKEGFIKFLDTINAMNDVWIVTNWQGLQWVRDPTPINRINSFQPFQCNYQDRPKRCNNPKVCNLWHKSGVRYMRTCQPCPEIYPWTGKSGIRSSRVDHDIEE